MIAEHFARFARYNRWANAWLYAAAAELPDAEYRADRGAFFRSVHGTLNHLLVADRLWLARLTGEENGPLPTALNQILFEDHAALTEARVAEDERLVRYADELDEDRLEATLSYRTTAGVPQQTPVFVVLGHMFNHQTHHRGQVHTLLTQMGRQAPALDLIYYYRETDL